MYRELIVNEFGSFHSMLAIEQIGSIKSGEIEPGDFKNLLYRLRASDVVYSSFIFPNAEITNERSSASVCLSVFLGSQPNSNKFS